MDEKRSFIQNILFGGCEANQVEQKCCLCEKTFVGFGNNPQPLPIAKTARGDTFNSRRCCDECNKMLVLPIRAGFGRDCYVGKREKYGEKVFYIYNGDGKTNCVIPYFHQHLPQALIIESQAKEKHLEEKKKKEAKKIKDEKRRAEEAERRKVENEMIAKRKEESAKLEAEYNAAKQREFEERLKALERREAEKKEEEKREKERKAKEAEERKAKKEAEKAEKQKQFHSKRK